MYHTALEIDVKDILTATVDGGPSKDDVFIMKEKYLLMKHIAGFLVQCEQTIFGGYVRDMLINNNAAQLFYIKGGTSSTYAEKEVIPETYDGRMTFPHDIDVFTENIDEFNQVMERLCRNNHKISGLFSSTQRQIKNYCHHPLFATNFNVFRYDLTYKYNSSLQNDGKIIQVHVDVVCRSEFSNYAYPWDCICDCVSNLMYLNNSGVQIGKIGLNLSPIEKSIRFAKIIELTLDKKTFISWPSYEFRSPTDAIERRSIDMRFPHIENISQAYIKLRYREKFFERLIKMYKKGFTIINSPLKLYTWSTNDELNLHFSNNEKYCCISHEEFKCDEIVIRFLESKSVMKEKVFYDYIRQTPVETPRYAGLIGGDWVLTCPVSGRITKSFIQSEFGSTY